MHYGVICYKAVTWRGWMCDLMYSSVVQCGMSQADVTRYDMLVYYSVLVGWSVVQRGKSEEWQERKTLSSVSPSHHSQVFFYLSPSD